jgi:hypothetical protein
MHRHDVEVPMLTREIPRTEWSSFCKSFSAEHQRWSCTVEVFHDSLGAQVVSDGMPLAGVDADLDHDDAIEISLGDEASAHLMHVVVAPRHLWLAEADDGTIEAIEIESDEAKTLVRVHPLPPG